jgi:hypothetical protein
LDELRNDACNQCLEFFIPPVFLGVEYTVTMNNPTHVARPAGPENVLSLLLQRSNGQFINHTHRLNQAFA